MEEVAKVMEPSLSNYSKRADFNLDRVLDVFVKEKNENMNRVLNQRRLGGMNGMANYCMDSIPQKLRTKT